MKSSKLYILSEVDILIFDFIVLMIFILIIDDVFEFKIKSVEELSQT